MEMLEMKKTITEMNDVFNRLNSRFGIAEEIITGFNSSTKITQMETQSAKRIKNKQTNSRTEHRSFEGQYRMVTDIYNWYP